MENELSRVVDALPGLVWTALPDGNIDFLNQRWREYTGLSVVEACGRGWQTAVHPEDLAELHKRWQSILASEEPGEMEARLRRLDGEYRLFLLCCSPLRDASGQVVKWCGINTDVEDRRQEEEAVRADERRLIVDGLPGLVTTNTPTGEVEFVNREVLDYFGGTVDELKRWASTEICHPDDLPDLITAWRRSVETGNGYDTEARLRRADGTYRWFRMRGLPVRDSEDRVMRWCVLHTDIDDRKLAEEAIRSGEHDLRSIINTIPMTAWSTRPDGYCDFCNQRWLDYTGLSLEQVQGWGWGAAIHPDDLKGLVQHWQSCLTSGAQVNTEARMRRFDGVYRWFLFLGNPLRDESRDESGDIVKWFGTNVDIEDRKRADEALRASERDLIRIINTIPTTAWATRPDGYCEFLSDRWLDYAGFTYEDAVGWRWATAIHPEDAAGLQEHWLGCLATGTPVNTEARIRRFDGVYRWFLFLAQPFRDESGTIVKWYGTNVDIEDRKRVDEALRVSERNLRQLTETIPEMLWSATSEGAIDYCNGRLLEYTGFTAQEIAGDIWTKLLHPDDVEQAARVWMSCVATAAPYRVEVRTFHVADRTYRWCETNALPLLDQQGHILKWHGTVVDMHDRKQAEQELRRSEAFLAHGQRLNLTGSFSWRIDTDEITFSEQLYRIFEFEHDSPLTLEEISSRVHPEDIPLLTEKINLARTDIIEQDYEIRLRMPDGSVKYLRTKSYGVRDREGRLEHIGAIQDVTERRLAEQALGKVRSELAHMTRVASLGALTASVAHEVNQPLSGIVTNASTCLRMLAADPPNVGGALETARRMIRDGNRASEVITRLRLLFSKKEAAIEQVDLNEATREVIALSSSELQRNHVIFRSELSDNLPLVTGDRVQLQQVISNLLQNASDAMSAVDNHLRKLVIRTEEDEGGRVRLTVKDSGVGFQPQGMDKLFEAFYTTKSGGMGIGLSVSRSIIESHHGRLWATLNDGPGATFSFSIPRRSEDVRTPTDQTDLQHVKRNL